MSLVVVRDPAEPDREDAWRREMQRIQDLLAKQQAKEPHIVMESTCPTCGQTRYVPVA